MDKLEKIAFYEALVKSLQEDKVSVSGWVHWKYSGFCAFATAYRITEGGLFRYNVITGVGSLIPLKDYAPELWAHKPRVLFGTGTYWFDLYEITPRIAIAKQILKTLMEEDNG